MAPGSIPADATEIHQEGLRIPPVLLTAEVRGRPAAPTRARRTSGGATSTPRSGANVVGVERLAAVGAGAPLDEVVAYGERRMRAALAAVPDGAWTFEDVLDSCGPRPEQQRPARIVVTRHDRRATTVTVRLHRHRRAAAGQRQRRRGGHGERGVVRPAVGDRPDDPGQRRRAAPGRRWSRPPGTVVAARPPAAVGAGNVEVSQRVADVCLGALAQAAARPGGRRRPGDDEQRAHRRRRLGVLRDRRRRAGRPPRPGRA